MADAKLTALTAASALAAADLFYVSQSAASRKATGTQLLTLVGTTYVPLAGGTMAGPLTNTSSFSGSNFYVNPNGNIGFNTPATGFLFWDDSGDVRLYRDAAATLAQRNGANAQTLRVYRSYTDESNYSRLAATWNTSTALLMAEGLGTEKDGNVAFNDEALATGATRGYIMVPSAAGVSTGVPADIPTGQTPIVFDSTNKKIGAYTGGAWVWTAALS